jgi:predicted nucleic acid-binding protein
MPLLDTPILLDRARQPRARLETVDAFPPGHRYARTRWDRAYFDIASDLKPDAIERSPVRGDRQYAQRVRPHRQPDPAHAARPAGRDRARLRRSAARAERPGRAC